VPEQAVESVDRAGLAIAAAYAIVLAANAVFVVILVRTDELGRELTDPYLERLALWGRAQRARFGWFGRFRTERTERLMSEAEAARGG
jgi:hypothetical protein